jgi:predicted small secreted protein
MISNHVVRSPQARLIAGEAVRIAIGLAMLIGLIVVLHGCNTVEGAGEDIESAGESIQDAAD